MATSLAHPEMEADGEERAPLLPILLLCVGHRATLRPDHVGFSLFLDPPRVFRHITVIYKQKYFLYRGIWIEFFFISVHTSSQAVTGFAVLHVHF